MVRVVCCVSAAVLLALVNSVIAAAPVTFTPEEPPKFAVLKAADEQVITLLYWKPVFELSTSGPPALVNQPREFSIEQSKVVGRTVAGKTLDNAKAWQATVGTAMVLVPHDTTIDELYTKALNPETVLVQPKEAVAKEIPAPYPDGTLPANTDPAGNTTPEANAAPQPGAPTPEEVADAQKAIAPEVAKLKLKVAPTLITNPVINQALPGYKFFTVPSDSDEDDGNKGGNRRPVRMIIKNPDNSVQTVGRDDDDENNNKNNSNSIFAILRQQMTVLTVADARRYARVHLLLAGARHPKYTFGPVNNIKVTQESNGGLMVYAEMPFTGGVSPNAPKKTAFTLTANFSKTGKVLGGVRSRR